MNLALWALPAAMTLVGMVAILFATRRLAEEAALLKVEVVRVRDLGPELRQIQAEARALRVRAPGARR